ncbi:hypothetical protein HDE_10052 [Halotydeus destructor]|nr:hypothetical protein HDE_10052 [Halotydeus destructor]
MYHCLHYTILVIYAVSSGLGRNIETPKDILDHLANHENTEPARQVHYDMILNHLSANRGRIVQRFPEIHGSLTLHFNHNGSQTIYHITAETLENHRRGSGPLQITLPVVRHEIQSVEAMYQGADMAGLNTSSIRLGDIRLMNVEDRGIPWPGKPAVICAQIAHLETNRSYLAKFHPCTI